MHENILSNVEIKLVKNVCVSIILLFTYHLFADYLFILLNSYFLFLFQKIHTELISYWIKELDFYEIEC